MPYRIRRCLGACALAVVALLAFSGTAAADSASISVTTTAGKSDPVTDVPRTFTLSGNVASEKNYFVKYRRTGGAPCAGSAEADAGETLTGSWYGSEDVNGDFSNAQALTWSDPPGAYLFCIWLAEGENQVVTPISQVIRFRSPTGTISAIISPTSPRIGRQTTVTVSGSSEADREVYAIVRGAGAPCAPTPAADSGSSLIYGDSVNGTFGKRATWTPESSGNHVICLWLANGENDATPIAGPQPVPFTVAARRKPACVVPRIKRGTRLATAKRRIRAARCRVGKVRRKRSAVRRGRVVKTTLPRGTRLRNRARVGLVVSRGRR
jgi:hypothetical protein